MIVTGNGYHAELPDRVNFEEDVTAVSRPDNVYRAGIQTEIVHQLPYGRLDRRGQFVRHLSIRVFVTILAEVRLSSNLLLSEHSHAVALTVEVEGPDLIFLFKLLLVQRRESGVSTMLGHELVVDHRRVRSEFTVVKTTHQDVSDRFRDYGAVLFDESLQLVGIGGNDRVRNIQAGFTGQC